MNLPHRQHGAAALFAAIGMVGMLLAAAFGIDLAQLYLAKRELNNMANLAVLDAAQAAGGCLAPDMDRQSTANAAVQASLAEHGGSASWLMGSKANLGRIVIDGDGLRQFQEATEDESREAYAFEVLLQRPFPNLVLPLATANEGGASINVRAAAVSAPSASFKVGSFLASVGASDVALANSLFESIFGASPNLGVASYEGLLTSSVQLRDIAVQLGNVPLDELRTDPIFLPGLLEAVAGALLDSGQVLAASAVDQIAAVAPNDTVVLGDSLGTPQQLVQSIGGVSIDTLELVRSVALQLGDPVLALTPGLIIPGLSTLGISAALGEVPRLAVGPAFQDAALNYLTTASNTQGVVDLDLGLLPVLGNAVSVTMRIEIANAQASLQEIRCANRTRSQHEVDIGVDTALARLVIDNPPSNPLVDLLITKICWEGEINIAEVGGETLSFIGPFDPDDPATLAENTQSASGGSLGASLATALSDLATSSPPYVCGPVGLLIDPILSPVLAIVSSTVGPVLSGLVDPLLEPLMGALGVKIAGADVTVLDVKMSPPALIATD